MAKLKTWLETRGEDAKVNGTMSRYMGIGDGSTVIMKASVTVEGQTYKGVKLTVKDGRTVYLLDSVPTKEFVDTKEAFYYRMSADGILEKAVSKRKGAAPVDLPLSVAQAAFQKDLDYFLDRLVR